MTDLETQRVLSGMCKTFPRRGGRRITLFAGLHAVTLARFIEKAKLGRPTSASYSEKKQMKLFPDL